MTEFLEDLRGGVYHLALGEFVIVEHSGAIIYVQWTNQNRGFEKLKPSSLSDQCAKEMDLYSEGRLTSFSVPLRVVGSVFEQKVWQELNKIPYAQVRSYAQIAQSINNPRASRAVGTACSKNPILILIPCHRVIRSDGRLGGYAGGVERKTKLLNIESSLSESLLAK